MSTGWTVVNEGVEFVGAKCDVAESDRLDSYTQTTMNVNLVSPADGTFLKAQLTGDSVPRTHEATTQTTIIGVTDISTVITGETGERVRGKGEIRMCHVYTEHVEKGLMESRLTHGDTRLRVEEEEEAGTEAPETRIEGGISPEIRTTASTSAAGTQGSRRESEETSSIVAPHMTEEAGTESESVEASEREEKAISGSGEQTTSRMTISPIDSKHAEQLMAQRAPTEPSREVMSETSEPERTSTAKVERQFAPVTSTMEEMIGTMLESSTGYMIRRSDQDTQTPEVEQLTVVAATEPAQAKAAAQPATTVRTRTGLVTGTDVEVDMKGKRETGTEMVSVSASESRTTMRTTTTKTAISTTETGTTSMSTGWTVVNEGVEFVGAKCDVAESDRLDSYTQTTMNVNLVSPADGTFLKAQLTGDSVPRTHEATTQTTIIGVTDISTVITGETGERVRGKGEIRMCHVYTEHVEKGLMESRLTHGDTRLRVEEEEEAGTEAPETRIEGGISPEIRTTASTSAAGTQGSRRESEETSSIVAPHMTEEAGTESESVEASEREEKAISGSGEQTTSRMTISPIDSKHAEQLMAQRAPTESS
ncbi:unnamed protein product, partial [Echinostoma caproni]|uniref:4_1_CTD domain-containing protein n=1 Tax=Echinostoma caproni TaxID=27848 RepID=A0A183ALZ0_9TREM